MHESHFPFTTVLPETCFPVFLDHKGVPRPVGAGSGCCFEKISPIPFEVFCSSGHHVVCTGVSVNNRSVCATMLSTLATEWSFWRCHRMYEEEVKTSLSKGPHPGAFVAASDTSTHLPGLGPAATLPPHRLLTMRSLFLRLLPLKETREGRYLRPQTKSTDCRANSTRDCYVVIRFFHG